jgi:hypothetical protein
MSVRAKFKVTEVKQIVGIGVADTHTASIVTMTAAHGAGNQTWSKWTPSGSLNMHITNPEALNQLKLGSYFYLDFTEAPATEEDEAK